MAEQTNSNMFGNSTLLITGGTGTFGNAVLALACHPEQRHALKQSIELVPIEPCDHAWDHVVKLQ
jgi:cytochrome P450